MSAPNRFSRLSEFVRHPSRLLHRDREPEPCDLCEFSPNVQFSSNHPLDAWVESANKGCIYCHMLVLVTQDLKEKHGVDITDGGKGTICLNGGEQSREAARCFITASKDNHTNMVLLYNAFDATWFPLKDLPFDCHISPSADSKACMDLVEQWLNECGENHDACNKNPPSSWVPTRLVDVGDGPHYGMPKLVPREQVPKGYQFVALSHCWGKFQPLRTLTDNFASHCEGIDPSTLPTTFLHAIRLTRALGLRYIWIDSLCIIQDDKLDWEREAAKMAQVYGNAALVLAASSAGSGEAGFLVPRKTYFQGQVELSKTKSSRGISYTVSYRPLFRHAHRTSANFDGPLGSRAWTFQERALAKRFVSFGKDELTWECRSLNDCECDHVWLRRGKVPVKHHPFLVENPDMDWMELSKLAIYAKLENASPRDVYFEWRQNVVHPYSHRKITFDSDKLVALSAIASTFQGKLGTDEQYLAGLWRGDLVRGLAWLCVVPRMVSKNYFPSWSWASLNGTALTLPGAAVRGGGVTFAMALKHFNFENTCVVLDSQCVPMSTINPWGSVENGAFIKLNGKLTPAVIEFHPRDSDGWKNVGSKAIGASDGSWEYCVKGMGGMMETRYSLNPDTLLEGGETALAGEVYGGVTETLATAIRSSWNQEGVLPPGRAEPAEYPAWCFLLGTYKSMETRGSIILVLGRTLTDADKFERLGLFEIDLGYKDEATTFAEWEESVITLV